MEAKWLAEGVLPQSGWTRVPGEGIGEPEKWFQSEITRIRSWWGEEAWGPGVEAAIRDALTDAVAKASELGTLSVMLHWPLDIPVPSRVRIVLAAGAPLDASGWRDAGFDVDEYPGAALGPGLKCVALREETINGADLQLFTAVYAFGDESGSVLVIAEAGSQEVFQLTMAGLPVLLSTLRVTEPNGKQFAADPVPTVTRKPTDEWESISNA